REPSIEKVEGKPVQEDVGDRVPDITQSEPPKMNYYNFKLGESLPFPSQVITGE
ncbi:hypothetical protein A2U01_0065796, partial [Trifolium medium]|nr:hypothetical protein [Trifolium medium]